MKSAVAITGLGLITPLGDSAGSTWDALLAGEFLSNHARVQSIRTGDRALELAQVAGHDAVRHAGWTREQLNDAATALIVGTSKGPIEAWMDGPNPQMTAGLAQIAGALMKELGLGAGPRLTYSAACASGLHALIRGVMMLMAGEATRAIIIGVEASVNPLFLGSFRRLGVIAPPDVGCRPFDCGRRGFVMSEAAAAVCLERADDIGARAIARVDRFALGGDATHLTAGDPAGRNLARLLRLVVHDQPVDLVHAHGTGTIVNDPSELSAIESVIAHAENLPPIYSHKGALGHSLGASGLVSIVLNCLAHQQGLVPGNVQTRDPISSGRMKVHRENQSRAVRKSVAIATGFGGPTAVVSLIAGSSLI